VVKLSSLLYCFSVGAGLLLLPTLIPYIYGAAFEGAATYLLALLLPTAFENWVRGCCSPALLRNGYYKQLAALNVLQAVATLAAIVLAHQQSLIVAVIVVSITRASVAALNLAALCCVAEGKTCLVPLQALAITTLAVGLGWLAGESIPLVSPLRALFAGAAYALLFFLGVRQLVLRDRDTLDVIHRLAGPRAKNLTWLIPGQTS
jgi:hypothetical protein